MIRMARSDDHLGKREKLGEANGRRPTPEGMRREWSRMALEAPKLRSDGGGAKWIPTHRDVAS